MSRNESVVDLLVVGGGINGAGVAADAAGRGLSVTLCEAGDLARATSSWSSKLIHGGLRYLENYEFRLVREALGEREVLLQSAPHLVTPLRFRMPHHSGLRPAWMIRIGLFLYDNLSKRVSLPGSKGIRFDAAGPVRQEFRKGFEYSDCRADDARLVVVNALQAARKGAEVLTRHRVVSARRDQGEWLVRVQPEKGELFTLRARALVNAGGPWVRDVLDGFDGVNLDKTVRLVKGSHILVPRIHDEDAAYLLQNRDGRIVFVIPYLDDYSLIGTTDVDYQGDPGQPEIDDSEIEYLLAITHEYFRTEVSREDIVWTYSGVRPLMQGERADDDQAAASVSRDYHFETQDAEGKAPLLSIFGGKLTTYRKLSEAAVSALKPYFPAMQGTWTRAAKLPGGDQMTTPDAYAETLRTRFPFLDQKQAKRISYTYGSVALEWLGTAVTEDELGPRFGPLYRAEVDYLRTREWAVTAEDILWRRTKVGLGLAAADRAALEAYLASD